MKLIKPSVEILEQSESLEGVYKQVELAGRTCYKSEDKITEGSAKKFVDMMIKSGHGAMLEHGTVYLYFPWVSIGGLDAKYSHNKYSKVTFYSNAEMNENGTFTPIEYGKAGHYVTTNMRVLVENNWLDDLKYACEPTEYHSIRVTVKWNIDRVTGESFLRHRVFSFARESTRYCNFSKNKFGNEITCVVPSWCNEKELIKYGKNHLIDRNEKPESTFMAAMNNAEAAYFSLLDQGWKPQQARQVLPFSLYSPLIMTGFIEDWMHFFELRCDISAHPDAQYLANMLKGEFIKRNYIK